MRISPMTLCYWIIVDTKIIKFLFGAYPVETLIYCSVPRNISRVFCIINRSRHQKTFCSICKTTEPRDNILLKIKLFKAFSINKKGHF